MVTLEPASMADAIPAYRIIDDARNFQREQGFVQWTAEYPNLDTIRADVLAGRGYVLRADGLLAGYLCVDFGGEPTYGGIRGAWGTAEPYAVVHRMGLHRAFRGVGLADTALELTARLCLSRNVRSLRADTDPSNGRMQHILEKNGFVRRGVVLFQGGERLAYDKTLR